MEEMTGVARLRQAIENQRDAGEACFTLPIGEAAAICDECEDELATLLWAKDVPTPKDSDGVLVPLDATELYTDEGEMVRVDSICHGGRLWHVKRMHSDKTYRLDSLHLRRPDSWEGLEADIESLSHKESVCRYFGHGNDISCDVCPAEDIDKYCSAAVARDILHRAKALVERDMKEASRG